MDFRGPNRLWANYSSLLSKSKCTALTLSSERNDSDSKEYPKR